MSGRHSQRGRHRRRRSTRLGVVVIIFALLAAGGAVLARDALFGTDDEPPTEAADSQAQCEHVHEVTVVAAPTIAPVLDDILAAAEPDGTSEGVTCISVDVSSVPSSVAVETLAGDDGPDVWVPESSLWVARAAEAGAPLGEARPIATSPLVMVAPQDVARDQLGWPDAEFAWTDALAGEATVAIADPMSTTEGLATLLAVQAAVGDSEDAQTRLVETLTTVSRSAVGDVGEAYGQVLDDPGAAPLFTATEQSVLSHNSSNPDHPVVALYPAEGTAILDYPAVEVGVAGDNSQDEAEPAVVAQVVDALTGAGAVGVLHDAGFRGPDGVAGAAAESSDAVQAQMPAVMDTPEPEAVRAALRHWAALSLEMRMLAVIDVSGSMWETDGGEETRIELVRDANLAALELIPPTGELGLWVFSTEEDPPNHWRELVDIGPLTEEVGDGTRRDALTEQTLGLPDSEVRGWTALYDTMWAAYQEVRDGYDPNKVNSVVLLTDGTDERAPDMAPGMDLDTLLTQLQAQHDPARPILLITIGIGPEADMDALRQISEVTGSTAYQAEDPADIQEIFFRAMLERQCRPNC
ncbi:substrate-binding and VWA domain-containing protein [Phytoactinopolyspora limicola]|uniref:substrate-binding and VWA domain-containing protein n=1 Tax=Phytoactinopolyspora limicola TaxID=2715536 RepID=UPI00140A8EBB|nr:substrate-binding and VWA domain-containing protein [Phytoactinopolyspora limicola]